ncbi:ATP-binding protein [Gloeocapsa sp. BRSZ]
MSNPELYDFITNIPSCRQTTQLKAVLEILQQTQCDRVVVVNNEQIPVGVLSAAQLLLHLSPQFQAGRYEQTIHQAVTTIGRELIKPIAVLPANLSIAELGLRLQSLHERQNTRCDWVIVDTEGKFLGVIDRVQLSEFFCLNLAQVSSEAVKQVSDRQNQLVLDLLVQLLEKLPCPLILQTTTGEVVMQNSAWSRHFGGLSDPEEVRRKVESILDSATVATQAQSTEHTLDSEVVATSAYRHHSLVNSTFGTQQLLSTRTSDEYDAVSVNDRTSEFEPAEFIATANRCQLGTQANTCICIWSLPNGQERVWEFIKIPLQEDRQTNDTESEAQSDFAHLLPVSSKLWLLLATDITEQQQLALELAAKNADLIQLNRLKDEFLSCISHELKTPLTAVLGLSTLLKDQALGELNERQSRYAKLIHQSGRHLMSVVNDILDLTRMETGQLKLNFEQVKIRNVCDRALEQVRVMQAQDRQATAEAIAQNELEHHFSLEIEPGLDTIIADELRLRQMLVHLLGNAFKFTESGEIGLRVSRWAGWIAFTVWDTGIGIPEQQQHLIFQKFQQLENPLTRRFKGTGLGLVLTRTLARLHAGDVSFLSKEGKGSAFTLLLPPHPPTDFRLTIADQELQSTNNSQTRHHNPNSTQKPKLSHRLVLLVEAAPRYIATLTEQLSSLGYRVVNARSGTEALEKARRLQPEMIFLNPLLPLLSGWDVLTLLKSDPATRQIPVIVTATRAEKEQALANRADEFINLPVSPEILPQVLARFCHEPVAHPQAQTEMGMTKDRITILRLVYGDAIPLIPQPSQIHYRILEADDLEQAEILVSIWQPDVVLLDGDIAEPVTYLESLSQFSKLAALPIVTLDAATTQAANQIEGLAVFPCLLPRDQRDPETLLSVLQFAAGMQWKPNILVVDVATLPDLQTNSPLCRASHSSAHGTEWFQALIPYLETAGFNGAISHSWAEMLNQIRQASVDLILICIADIQLNMDVLQALQNLENEKLPPILVLNGQLHPQLDTHQTSLNRSFNLQIILDRVLQAIATEILPPLSIQELLDKIVKTLALSAAR